MFTIKVYSTVKVKLSFVYSSLLCKFSSIALRIQVTASGRGWKLTRSSVNSIALCWITFLWIFSYCRVINNLKTLASAPWMIKSSYVRCLHGAYSACIFQAVREERNERYFNIPLLFQMYMFAVPWCNFSFILM